VASGEQKVQVSNPSRRLRVNCDAVPISEQNDEWSVATEDDSSNTAGHSIKNPRPFYYLTLVLNFNRRGNSNSMVKMSRMLIAEYNKTRIIN